MTRRDDIQKIPDSLIDRAVELWCRALLAPKFDNGDKSLHGFLTVGLSGMALQEQMARIGDFADRVEAFRVALSTRMKFLRDHEGEPLPEPTTDGRSTYYFDRHLSCDYDPDPDLAVAGKEAGIPANAFSWKSYVGIRHDCVYAKFGYGAGDVYHYPLAAGGWLVCRLHGEDMPAIIAAVEAGTLTGMMVEPAPERS